MKQRALFKKSHLLSAPKGDDDKHMLNDVLDSDQFTFRMLT